MSLLFYLEQRLCFIAHLSVRAELREHELVAHKFCRSIQDPWLDQTLLFV